MVKKLVAFLLTLCLLLSVPVSAAAEESAQDYWTLLFDSVELAPASPGSAELDAYLDELMGELFLGLLPEDVLALEDPELIELALEELTTYQKTLACYDYVMANVSYGSHVANLGAAVGDTTCRAIYNKYGAVEGFGAVALSAKTGMCNAYASAFILMARKIGLNAYLVKGYTRRRGGGSAYHEWAEIAIGDEIYVFDPQLDQSLANQGLGSYNIFGKTYANLSGRYTKT